MKATKNHKTPDQADASAQAGATPTTLTHDTETPSGWTVTNFSLGIIHGGPAIVNLQLELDPSEVAPLAAAADEREKGFRERSIQAIRDLRENCEYQAAAARLVELDTERERLKLAVEMIEAELTTPVSPHRLGELGEKQAQVRNRQVVVERAREHAQLARDDAARKLHTAAVSIARTAQVAAIEKVAAVECSAGGLLDAAREQLAKLIEYGRFGGAIKFHGLPDQIATQAVLESTGGRVPSVPPVPRQSIPPAFIPPPPAQGYAGLPLFGATKEIVAR